MIIHLFNSSSVSGPERLVLPALANVRDQFMIVNLLEDRIDRLRESDPLEEYCRSLNLRYRNIRVKGRWDRGALDALHRLLRQLRPDLVHAHAIKASIYLQWAGERARESRIPTVSTHHGIHGLPDWKTRLYEWLYRKHFLKSFDRTLSVSTADYNDLLNSGIGKKKLRLHFNGIDGRLIDLQHRSEEKQKIRARWFPHAVDPNGLFLFGVVGRISHEKNHDRLLQVLSCLNQLPCDQDWKCLIFGVGTLKHKLEEQVGRLGLEKRIVWMGYRNDAGNELVGLDAVLSFSKAEGLPINLIEAGWAGTAVMATCVGGVLDLIPDESYGVRVLPHEPPVKTAHRMMKFLSAEGQGELLALGQRFQERVIHEFTQEKWIKRLEDIYAELHVDFARSNEQGHRTSKISCY